MNNFSKYIPTMNLTDLLLAQKVEQKRIKSLQKGFDEAECSLEKYKRNAAHFELVEKLRSTKRNKFYIQQTKGKRVY